MAFISLPSSPLLRWSGASQPRRNVRNVFVPLRLCTTMCVAVQTEISNRKAAVYAAVNGIDLGRDVLDDEAARTGIDELVKVLEAVNPTPAPARSESCAGRWRLAYTDSEVTLGATRPSRFYAEEIWQSLNLDTEVVEMGEQGTFRLFGKPMFKWRNLIYGKFREVRGTRLRLKFERFLLGGFLDVKLPAPVVGWQEQTFLDEDTRICRTHLGSIIILRREDELPSA